MPEPYGTTTQTNYCHLTKVCAYWQMKTPNVLTLKQRISNNVLF